MTTPPEPPPVPTDPPTVGATDPAVSPPPAPPSDAAVSAPSGGGVLVPVTLARPTRDACGGSAAYASEDNSAGADGKPDKGGKNTASPGMWKGIAAYLANRPQQKIAVQHTISEIRGSSTDRKINHQVAEKRGATTDAKSNRTATTTHASKSDKSAKDHNTRDAKTSAASTTADKNSRDAKTLSDRKNHGTRSTADKNSRDAKTSAASTTADKNSNSRDAKTGDTRSTADKNSRDAKTLSDRKDHGIREKAGKASSDERDRTGRGEKGRKEKDTAGRQPPEGSPAATKATPKTPGPGSATAPAPGKAEDKPGEAKPDSASVPPGPQAEPGPSAPAGPAPAYKEGKASLRKGPYTAQPAREEGFNAGAQQAAAEADKAAWKDGYADGLLAVRDRAARDKAQMDAARDGTRGVPPVPAKPTAPPTPTTSAPVPASASASAPASGAAPLGATVSGDRVQLSNGNTLTRGEVRNLRAFTRFLDGKEQQTHQIVDQCKQAKEVSADRVQQIQRLIDQCQDPKLKGGKQLGGLAAEALRGHRAAGL
ncbi:hypothetical protein [Streptomyces sp. NPDC057909]|uniref:hypothetical protein n=1 Tax=Streptomyces sp. NPDC057909 TaxID=3346277 RepID=UPI0036E8ED76